MIGGWGRKVCGAWKLTVLLGVALGLASCGGGGGGAGTNSAAAGAALQSGSGIQDVVVGTPGTDGMIPMTVTPITNSVSTADTWQQAYCFLPEANGVAPQVPRSDDACFMRIPLSPTLTVNATRFTGNRVYVYARNVIGQVSSEPFTVTIPAAIDSVDPTISSATFAPLTAAASDGSASSTTVAGKLSVAVTARDNFWIDRYCVQGSVSTTAPDKPSANHECFAQVGGAFTIDTKSIHGKKTLWIWARDAAGRVSNPQSVTLSPTSGPDNRKPYVQIVSIERSETRGRFKLTVTASDDLWVSGYCVRSGDGQTPVAPSSGDACFQPNPQIDYLVPGGGSEIPAQTTVWVVDSAGNVGGAGMTDPTGPSPVPYLVSSACSAEGLSAASNSIYPKAVCLGTSVGELVIGLYSGNLSPGQQAPTATIDNFLRYVNDGFYANTVFHRLASAFVAQGGGFTYDGVNYTKKTEGQRDPIALEGTDITRLSNAQYTVTMARTKEPNSASNEFFINLLNNNCSTQSSICSGTNLDASETNPGYAVFGRLIKGVDDALSTLLLLPTEQDDVLIKDNARSLPVPTPPVIFWARQVK